MKKQQIICANRGMRQDVDIANRTEEEQPFAYENKNIRIYSNTDNDQFAVTNEKGAKRIVSAMPGIYIGSCVINNTFVLFLHNVDTDGNDGIYTFNDGNTSCKCLYKGDLGFDNVKTIETLGYYESESVIKVYWIDGVNPNRFINIVDEKYSTTNTDDASQFNFQGIVNKIPNVTIEKRYDLSGSFNPGTIQYFITYFNKFGQETCLCYNSPIQYISLPDRGAKTDEIVSCGFKITIAATSIDTSYEYIRIYSYQRNELNGTGIANIVGEYKTNNVVDLVVTDLGTNNTAFSADDFIFIGGQDIRCSTFDQKQDTLFLGDVNINSILMPDIFKSDIDAERHSLELKDGVVIRPESTGRVLPITITETVNGSNGEPVVIQDTNLLTFTYKAVDSTDYYKDTLYSHKQQINKSQQEIAGFKRGEIYRFAIQLMSVTGEWTEPYWLGDKFCDLAPRKMPGDDDTIYIANITTTSTFANYLELYNTKYDEDEEITSRWEAFENIKAYRILMAETTPLNRRVVTQGVLNPTMFNLYDRMYNKPYTIDSWMFRPRGSKLANRHYDEVALQTSEFAEIQGITERKLPGIVYTSNATKEVPNCYCLVLVLDGDWITSCRVGYHLYMFYNDGQVTPVAENTIIKVEGNNFKAAPQSAHNTLLYRLTCGRGANEGNPSNTRAWLISDINDQLKNLANAEDGKYNPYGSFIADSMLPTGSELKKMATENGGMSQEKIAQIFAAIGTAILTAAAVVLSCVSFGTLAAPMAAATCACVAAVCTMGAALGGSAVASIAEQLKDAEDGVKIAAKYGFYPLANNFDMSKSNRKKYKEDYYNFMNGTFKNSEGKFKPVGESVERVFSDAAWGSHGSSGHGSNGSLAFNNEASIFVKIGRLDYKTAEQKELENKQDGFYIDESVLSFNTPELEDVKDVVNNSSALQLNLVGMIPVQSNLGTNSISASNGVSSQSCKLEDLDSHNFYSSDIEGLTCGNWYQDSDFQPITKSDEKSIKDSGTVQLIKNFMFNRDSLSIYNSNVLIEDPVQLASDTTSYLSYIPGKINKKIVANLRSSDNTLYNIPHLIDIETPITFDSLSPSINKYSCGGEERIHQSVVEAVSLNKTGYPLLKDSGNEIKYSTVDDSKNKIKDPISIKFNTTDHFIVPLKWEYDKASDTKGLQRILPYTKDEINSSIFDLYDVETTDNLSTKYDIPGYDSNCIEEYNTYSDTDFVVLQTSTNYNSSSDDAALTNFKELISKWLNAKSTSCKFQGFYYFLNAFLKYFSAKDLKDYINAQSFYNTSDYAIIYKYGNNKRQLLYPALSACDQIASLVTKDYLERIEATTDAIIIKNIINKIFFNSGCANKAYRFGVQFNNDKKIIVYITRSTTTQSTTVDTAGSTATGSTIVDTTQSTIGSTTVDTAVDTTQSTIVDTTQSTIGSTTAGSTATGSTIRSIARSITTTQGTQYIITAKEVTDFDSDVTGIEDPNIVYINANYYNLQYVLGTYRTFYQDGVVDEYQRFVEIKENYYYGRTFKKALLIEPQDKDFLLCAADEYNAPYADHFIQSTSFMKGIAQQTDRINYYKSKAWPSDHLKDWSCDYPYLFMGELVKSKYDWISTPSEYDLQQINWNVCSIVSDRTNSSPTAWGDTYYQRWDCLKTYPTSEEDTNGVVDILSFMLESRTNLDGRCDVNRGASNIVNARPTNFNLFNAVYNKTDNLFQYKITDEAKQLSSYPTQVVWSLTKTPMSTVDSWTSISAVNYLNLNGSFNALTKIINSSDTLLAFQENGISGIKYNEEAALTTTAGLAIQLGNTKKVDGYRIISSNIGCKNKQSIIVTSSGLFFADDTNKDFYLWNPEGIQNISLTKKFNTWFKNNASNNTFDYTNMNNFKSLFDNITNDLYYVNKDNCLVYNTTMQTFTSFMDYQMCPALFNLNGSSFILHQNADNISINKMFKGQYNLPLEDNDFVEYSMTYKVCPDALKSSMFTNFEYVADIINDEPLDSDGTLSDRWNTSDMLTRVKAWNEYQSGELDLTSTNTRQRHQQKKYRTWAGDIPRDTYTVYNKNYHANRMTNPWIYLKLTNDAKDNSRMIFHNLKVTYFN